MNSYEKVKLARLLTRPTSRDFIKNIFENFIEFHGDRNYSDDKAIVGGIALFEKKPVTVIGIQKGKDLDENIITNFGQVKPEGYRKSLRLMKQAEKFNRPIICFINTAGAFAGKSAEEHGQGEAIAKNLFEMSGLKVPIISIIIGEGGSGGALALSVSNKVYILENAVYSVLSPEGFASILWKDSKRANEAANLMKLTSKDLFDLDVIDDIICEAKEGIENNPELTYEEIKKIINLDLKNFSLLTKDELVEHRYKKFRKFGQFIE